MKNFNYLVLLSIFLFSVFSCKKETERTDQATTAKISSADLKLARMIETFKQQGQSNLKTGEALSIDSAQWYLEATANYTYGDASVKTKLTAIDSTFITLDVSDQTIDLSELWAKYEIMIDSIRSYYRGLNTSLRQLMSVEVKTISLTSTTMICKVTSTFATGGFEPYYCDFNPDDGWEALGAVWNGGGICSGPNYGLYQGCDAATEIQRKIMNCKPVPYGYYWYENPETIEIYAWDYNNPNWGGNYNYYRYRMYWNSNAYPDCHTCLTPDECNTYLSGTKWVIYSSVNSGGARPEGKSFISLVLTGELIDLNPPYNSTYFHWGYVQYGILHIRLNPPSPLQ
jgi:hypothetical protein